MLSKDLLELVKTLHINDFGTGTLHWSRNILWMKQSLGNDWKIQISNLATVC